MPEILGEALEMDLGTAALIVPPGSGTESQDAAWNQTPPVVAEYLESVTYDSSDYSASFVESYASQTTDYKKDEPVGHAVAVGSGSIVINDDSNGGAFEQVVSNGAYTVRNIAPTQSGGSFINSANGAGKGFGKLKTTGRLRWVYVPSLGYGYQQGDTGANVRDLGGWACDGGTVKYGLLFRGSQPDGENGGAVTISETDRKTFVDLLRVKKEIDLRSYDRGASSFGSTVIYEQYPYSMYAGAIQNAGMQQIFKQIFLSILDSVRHGEAVYFHCEIGCDRTGTVAFLLESLLGLSRSDLDKEYELSTFAYYGTASRLRTADTWKGMLQKFEELTSGADYAHRAAYYLEHIGISIDDINAFRAAMIDGNPAVLASTLSTYTISNTLSSATTDNSATTAKEKTEYTARIKPTNGNVISAVSVTVGGVDVTDSVWKGTKTVLRVSVQGTFTHCSTSNTKLSTPAGQPYVAYLSADTGYGFDGAVVSITMGGTDVSQYFSDGVIAIPEVTGNIVISVAAVPTVAPYTNLFDPSAIHSGMRINSGGSLEANANQNVSNDIAITQGETIRIKGSGANATANTYRVCYSFNNGESWTNAGYIQAQTDYAYDATDDVISFTAATNATPFTHLRFSFPATADASAIVVTCDEPIE